MNSRKVLIIDKSQAGSKTIAMETFKAKVPEVIFYDGTTPIVLNANTNYLLVGIGVYNYIAKHYRLGTRGMDLTLLSQLPFLALCDIENCNLVFAHTLDVIPDNPASKEQILNKVRMLHSDTIGVAKIDPHIKSKAVTTPEELTAAFADLNKHDGYYGFDYETSGLYPLTNPTFRVIGVGICTPTIAYYIDFRRFDNNEHLEALKSFLLAKSNKCIVYYFKYEFEVSYRLFKIEYAFIDAMLVRILDGYQWRTGSLKFNAQNYLGVKAWDEELEAMVQILDRHDWPAHIDIKYHEEIKSYQAKGYANGFSLPPTEIMTKYCCLDCYYTLMIYMLNKDRFSEAACLCLPPKR